MSRKMTKEEEKLMSMPTNDGNLENRNKVYEGLKEYYLHQTNSLKKVINV